MYKHTPLNCLLNVFSPLECHALCHPKCSAYLPSTCGMSSDCSLHLSDGLCRDKGSSAGQQLKEAGGHMHLEGWLKQPRSALNTLTRGTFTQTYCSCCFSKPKILLLEQILQYVRIQHHQRLPCFLTGMESEARAGRKNTSSWMALKCQCMKSSPEKVTLKSDWIVSKQTSRSNPASVYRCSEAAGGV